MLARLDASGVESGAREARQAIAGMGASARSTSSDMIRLSDGVSAAVSAARSQGAAFQAAGQQAADASRLAANEVNILAQQISDGAIQVASGQSLFTAILQQGSQVQFLLGSKGVNTIGGSLALLKQGLIGFLNPLNLALVGLAGGAAAATALYQAVANDTSATDALEHQDKLIGRLAERYDEVAAALDRLQARPSAAVLALDTDALESQRETIRSLIAEIERDVQRSLRLEAGALSALAEPLTQDAALFRAFQQELRATAETFSLAETEADLLIGRLLELARTAPDTTSERAIRALIDEARAADTGLLALVERLGEVEAALKGVGSVADSLGRIDPAANTRVGQAFGIFEERTALERLRSQLPKPQTRAGKSRRETDRLGDMLASQDQTLQQLRLEISLVGQSDAARRQALAVLEAEIQIRELGRHVTERGAASLRDNARAIAEETLALEDLETAWGVVQRSGEAAIRSLATRLADGDLTGALRSVIAEVSELGLQLLAINPLTNALFGTARPTFASVGGLLGPLLGSFDRGGPTGAGRDTDVAGLVHRNEYVFDARSTARIGVGTLEALRASALRGYQSGGLVTAATLPVSGFPVSGFPVSGPIRANAALSGPDSERPAGDTVIVNITTPDIQSFRASRSQLAGEFARMALRGRRNG
ncbi:phage tail length tape measure family protein [Pannonibacter carbonis]|uniref:phage tail length tape measure family protein n=1 Tax=Pannonibacter carbonis TaxID=2067569 RepID=UPI00130058B4|nr:phage tail length tape measure family protein [Pannonibacter carbonis]